MIEHCNNNLQSMLMSQQSRYETTSAHHAVDPGHHMQTLYTIMSPGRRAVQAQQSAAAWLSAVPGCYGLLRQYACAMDQITPCQVWPFRNLRGQLVVSHPIHTAAPSEPVVCQEGCWSI